MACLITLIDALVADKDEDLNCQSCIYGLHNDEEDLQCQRHPPKIGQGFPVVDHDDVCGEWVGFHAPKRGTKTAR